MAFAETELNYQQTTETDVPAEGRAGRRTAKDGLRVDDRRARPSWHDVVQAFALSLNFKRCMRKRLDRHTPVSDTRAHGSAGYVERYHHSACSKSRSPELSNPMAALILAH